MDVSHSKRNNTDPEPCQVAVDEIGPSLSPPPYNGSQQDLSPVSITCCGCVNIRSGVIAIIIVYLLLGILSILRHGRSSRSGFNGFPLVLSYIISGVDAMVNLVLLYTAAKCNVQVYRPAAKVNAVMFAVSVTMIIAMFDNYTHSVDLNPGATMVTLAIILVWQGYWTWVLYKYAGVMEVEAKGGQQNRQVSV